MTNQPTARVEARSEFIGSGCAIQALALVVPWPFALIGFEGFLLGLGLALVLFIVGSAKSKSYRCSACKNPVATKDVRVCPACKATLG
jgi:hypothetical protein